MATKKLSVLICTRNGARTISEAVTHSIAALTAWDPDGGELIVVDNGSTDDTAALAEAARSGSEVAFSLLSVPRPGKMHALETGVRAARADIICIIDDDNIVAVDFFSRMDAFFRDYPDVGIIGGVNELDTRASKPAWFEWAKDFMACARARVDDDVVVDAEGREIGGCALIAGAGMGFRKQPLLDALDAGYAFFNDTQRGRGMRVTGEDAEMCLLFRSMGHRFGYDPGMRLRHYLAQERLTPEAFWLLCRTIGAGSPGIAPFLFTTKKPPGRLPLKWTWQWQLLSLARRLVRIQMPWGVKDFIGEERRFRRRMATQQCRGAIARILAERSKCDVHTRNVASGPWTRYRVR